VPDVEVSSPNQIRVVYAVPSDGADNFGALASPIVTDVATIDAWWQRQDSTRSPRWDLYPFAGCGSRIGALDLAAVRLPHDTAYYRTGTAGNLDDDLAAALTTSSTAKTLVYFDGALSDPLICGESRIVPDRGGSIGNAYVFLRSNCELQVGDGGTAARTAAHELVHDLGGMPDSGPPHPCPGDSGHPCDSTADILTPYLTSGATLDSAVLDVGRDDYYGHNGSWFDVQDSGWLMHLPQLPLQVALQGSGSLKTTLPTDCGTGCTLTLDNGLTVSLEAVADVGWRFAGWQGACSGAAVCTLTMDAPKSATAVFTPKPQLVRVTVVGRGRVTSAPAGISCPGTCSHAFVAGATVRLVARPAQGRRLLAWAGACSGRSACVVRADRLRTVRVTFR
jgi:hypothetical protein